MTEMERRPRFIPNDRDDRLLIINWGILGGLLAALFVSASLMHFSVTATFTLGFSIALGFGCLLGILSAMLIIQRSARWPEMSHAASVLALMGFSTIVLLPLSYVAASANFPLQDGLLYAIDQWLGLNWTDAVKQVNTAAVGSVLYVAYKSIALLIWVPIVICFFGNVRRCHEFYLAYALSGALAVAISIVIPATSAYHYLGIAPTDVSNIDPEGAEHHMRGLMAVRSGSLRVLDISQLTGIVMFPSFHAVVALLVGWAMWPLGRVRYLAVTVSAAQIASTPFIGGHYFIDVIAGLALAIVCIGAARWLSNMVESSKLACAAAPDGSSTAPVQSLAPD
jgi:hypothetical protein